MENVKRHIQYLTNYEHVADFQKFCGIKILPVQTAEDSVTNGMVQNGDAGTKKNGVHHRNGKTVQNGVKNGTTCVPQEQDSYPCDKKSTENDEQKSQNGHSLNGSVKNGFSYHPGGQQKMMYKVENKFLYYIFEFGASLGSEMFYLTFYPFFFWNINTKMCRQFVFVWHILMYVGQLMKDFIKWPRPMAPAVRLERRFDMEYGMPSTHAIVGSCIPFSILYLSSYTYQFPFLLGLVLAVSWTTLVAFSRVYLGMHTAADVLAGQCITAVTLPWLLPHLDSIDQWIVTNPYAPLLTVFLPFLACIFYPKQKEWSITRGDTANIVSIGSGVISGCWLSYQFGYTNYPQSPSVLLPIDIPSSTWLWQSCLRFAVGVVCLATARQIFKMFYLRLLLSYYGLEKDDIQTQRKLGMEVPLKYFTLFSISFMTSFVFPIVFSYFSICRVGL